jgi:hypothetical protein
VTLHILAALALFAFGALGGVEWLRDHLRARRLDRDVERHPVARQLRVLREVAAPAAPPPSARLAVAEALRRREVVAEAELFDICAMQEWHRANAGERGQWRGA